MYQLMFVCDDMKVASLSLIDELFLGIFFSSGKLIQHDKMAEITDNSVVIDPKKETNGSS